MNDLAGMRRARKVQLLLRDGTSQAAHQTRAWEKVAEVFSRTPNGCGHRQIAMCLRAEDGVAIAEKTVLKIMSEMGIRCGIRKETDYHRYSSYRAWSGRPSRT